MFWGNPEAMTVSPSFACPACRTRLDSSAEDELRCPQDGLRFPRVDGVWRFLLPGRDAVYEQFIREYETVRRAEGRGSPTPEYYRALPYHDVRGVMPAGWQIRAASFDALLKRVVAPLERENNVLNVLDLGAGNGWLSNRLAARGLRVTAVDLLTNDFDGLGCYRQYETVFTPAQAEFDRLPFADGTIDLAIFNASLHYSVSLEKTLAEALRILHQEGRLVILDSPVYADGASGAGMVRERENQFRRQFGFASNSLPSENYLTYRRLQELGSTLQVDWQMLTPWYGLRWALKPLKARLLGRREPAKFHLLVGTKNGH